MRPWSVRTTSLVFGSLLVAGTSSVVAAEDTQLEREAAEVVDSHDDGIVIGGYGGLGIRYARLLERNTALACVEFAFLFEHSFSVGPGACSTVMSAEESAGIDADEVELEFGATTLRYHLMTDEPYSLSLGVMAGPGSIELVRDDGVRRTDSLIVVEPEVGGHILATSWMRVSVVGAYRFVSGVDTGGVTSSDVSGLSFGVNAHFGWF